MAEEVDVAYRPLVDLIHDLATVAIELAAHHHDEWCDPEVPHALDRLCGWALEYRRADPGFEDRH